MGLQIAEVVSLQGDGLVNEDFLGVAGGAAWVLDGATGVGDDALDAPSDAYWFVRTFAGRLETAIAAAPDAPAVALIRDVISRVKDDYDAALNGKAPNPAHAPSAAFIMARAIGGSRSGLELEFAALGDCAAYVKTVSGAIEVVDGAGPTPIDAGSLAALKRTHQEFPNASAEEVSNLVRPVLQLNRRRMNTLGGYWILSLDETAADHLVMRVKLVDPAAPIVLASDGFTRAVEMLDLRTPEEFYARVLNDGPKALANAVRAVESADPSCRRYPRFKCRDDATCMVLSID